MRRTATVQVGVLNLLFMLACGAHTCAAAVCARADSCPIDVAKTAGWCKDEDCWVSSAWAPSSSSALLSATLAAVTVLAASLRGLD
eukprot:1167684-Rhodomonas_salina.2